MISLVYVIGPEPLYPGSLVKIGVTTDVRSRLQTFQCGSPVRLSVLWAVPGDQALEAWLHNAFREYRKHGEWFDLGDDPTSKIRDTLGPYMINVVTSQVESLPILSRTDDLDEADSVDSADGDSEVVPGFITGTVRKLIVSDFGISNEDIYAAFDSSVARRSINKSINRVRRELDS